MKKLIYVPLAIIIFATLSSCATEDLIVDTHVADTEDIYQRRLKGIKAMFTTTLFTYTNTEEINQQIPNTIPKIENFSRDLMQTPYYQASTDAVYKIVIEDGKAKMWERHFIDTRAGKMVDSAYKPQDDHILHVLSREKYQETYNEVTDALANKYTKLGNYAKPVTVASLNNYMNKKISTANGSAQLYVKVNNDSVEIYTLQ